MLDRCRRAVADAGLDVVLHHQRMEELNLPRRYSSIFLAGPTFILLPDDTTALRSLRGIRAHLADDGAALVPLFVPAPTPEHRFGEMHEALAAEGALLRFSLRSEERDEGSRTRRAELRYERHAGTDRTVVDRTWTLHRHTQNGFRRLVTAAGLRTEAVQDAAGRPAADDATAFAFLLRAAG
ncbi:hypothetical protein SAMN05661080_00956 [Modestobacter sp. DSM 44400]|nr:hypothetical protein SAMN05661080_00956 [Modestobacter sp. DSM 44400]